MSRPTPETDAKWQEFCCSNLSWYHIAENIKAHCQEKERERDEARAELEEYRSIAENIGAEKAVSEKEKAIRERNEVQEKYDTLAVENMLEVNKICNQREAAMDVLSNLSHYLSCGLGDETTTAKEYGARIREGINALLDPIVEEKEKLRKMLDLQTKIVVDLEMRLMK